MTVIYPTDSNLTYEYDNETQKVTCCVSNCSDEFLKAILNKCNSMPQGKLLYDICLSTLFMNSGSNCAICDIYKGTAICHPSDNFSLEKGCDIARCRALAKREAAYAQFMIDVDEKIKSLVGQIFEIRESATLYNKHKTNAEAVAISGKTLKEIRGFE